MPSLTNILGRASVLSAPDKEWLHQLVGDWQTVSDVSFSDLLLAVPNDDGRVAFAAHCRPATATTLFDEDVVGCESTPDFQKAAWATLTDGVERTVSQSAFSLVLNPVRRGEARAIPPGRGYMTSEISRALVHMMATGEFPFDGRPTGYRHGTPRLTDGFVQIDPDGVVLYASPNAISNYHRLGIPGRLVGKVLAEEITETIEDYSVVDETLPVVVMAKAPWLTELESHGAILSLKAVPLRDRGRHLGGIVMCRDVTELRRREQELVSKDATIREVNHRVKNNLQTVSALLRMQSRRAANDETRAALENAQRRVATIALVHQTLSETIDEHVDFNEVFGPLLGLTREITATGVTVTSHLSGDFGRIGANKSTSLAIVLNELVSNAVEHGLADGGHIEVTASRDGDLLSVDIEDDGRGLGAQGPGRGLGTKIVRTLVESELRGSIRWSGRDRGGTRVRLIVDVGD